MTQVEPANFGQALIRAQQRAGAAPCSTTCASGADVRGWIALIAQRHKLGLSTSEAMTRAWGMVTAANPFPATLGRICPHPCESGCNRSRAKDGAVSINALERFLGDWGLQERLRLPRLEQQSQPESIGAIGAGPAGLSFAYQMARRGYSVTIYEREEKPGGMLYYGVPQYRLPEEVLDAEIKRILDLGVALKLNVGIGRDLTVQRLQEQHDVLFLGIGAGQGVRLGIPGESGGGVWTGTDYLSRVNRGAPVDLGTEVVVVGGGNTAMDSARSARRSGANVTLLYRRTQKEMPAFAGEAEEAAREGVRIEYLTAPIQILRENGTVRSVVAQRMRIGEMDDSGRGRPVPEPGSEHEYPASSVIAAVSQVPDWEGLAELHPGTSRIHATIGEPLSARLWAGGDMLGPAVAGVAIGQGRQAAEAVHARLRGLPEPAKMNRPLVPPGSIKPDYYAEKPRTEPACAPVEIRLAHPELEVRETMGEAAFLDEVSRCFSCGSCFGCEHCFTYCNAGGFTRVEQVRPGAYFALSLDQCEGCGKCIEVCPCGFLTPR